MDFSAQTKRANPVGGLTLVDTIARLRQEFDRMQEELREAHNEINRLKQKLSTARPRLRALPEVDIEALRRNVAYYCHPDRGGDNELMCSINMLLDFFEVDERADERRADAMQERAAA